MSGILMWHVGSQEGVPLSEPAAQATTSPIRDDGQSAEATSAPDFNEFESDSSSELMGLSHRMVGSDTVLTEKFPPWWKDQAGVNYNAPIDNQVSSSGTAAAREANGDQGHGTMQYALGIEPVLHDGMVMGNDYFLSNPNGIQDGAGEYMNPIGNDNWVNAVVQARGTDNSRLAAQSSLYSSFLGQ